MQKDPEGQTLAPPKMQGMAGGNVDAEDVGVGAAVAMHAPPQDPVEGHTMVGVQAEPVGQAPD